MEPANLSPRSAAHRLGRAIWASGLLVPLIFILVVVCSAPITDRREVDGDEGVNLMKAFLVYKGHAVGQRAR
jgi:hypothetical protein